MVNITIDGIFNGTFEKQKSAQNQENFAKNRAIYAGDKRVYHVDVKVRHEGADYQWRKVPPGEWLVSSGS